MNEKKNVLVAGAGGFIGGHLARRLFQEGYNVRAVDKKPLNEWWQVTLGTEALVLDLSQEENCRVAVQGVDWVFQLAADMGGIGFIEHERVACMRNVLINVHMLESAYKAGVERFLFSSSACAYNVHKQAALGSVIYLKEDDAYPAMAERGYGWEKLYSEMLCQEYWEERRLKTFIPRLHNVYGAFGSWCDGREKAPAAICRKVAEAELNDRHSIEIWGDGRQMRSFMYVDDCVEGMLRIINEDRLIGKPVNLGSSETVSVQKLVEYISYIAGWKIEKLYCDLQAPQGVGARSSDNYFIKSVLNWEPSTALIEGLRKMYPWIKEQVWKKAQEKDRNKLRITAIATGQKEEHE